MPIEFKGGDGGTQIVVHVSDEPVKADYRRFVPEFKRLVDLHGKLRALDSPVIYAVNRERRPLLINVSGSKDVRKTGAALEAAADAHHVGVIFRPFACRG